MKTVKTKRRVYNPVTGTYYNIYERKPEPGDKPIRGLWSMAGKKRNRNL